MPFILSAGEFLGLCCLKNPQEVPTSLTYVDANRLPAETLATLSLPRYIIGANQAQNVSAGEDRVPISYGDLDDPYVRFNANNRHMELYEDQERAAVQSLLDHIEENAFDVILRSGDYLYIDNQRCLHGRPAFAPNYDGSDRWLRRIYITESLRKSRHLRSAALSRLVRPLTSNMTDETIEIIPTRFSAGEETLSGQTVTNGKGSKPSVLFLHGAGQATKVRALPLAQALAKKGIASFAFDFSGHGESTGEMGGSSLQKRTEEAMSALQYLEADRPISVVGFSMGAHIALEMLKRKEITNLLLFYPGIYSKDAVSLPFGPAFSDAIRKTDSWKNADVVVPLRQFEGKLLIVIGEQDQVIPEGVIQMLEDNSPRATRKQTLVVPGAGHTLLDVVYQDNKLFNQLTDLCSEFLQTS